MCEKFQGFIREFIQEIIENDDWEYGDGTPMTQDAKKFLALYQESLQLQMNLECTAEGTRVNTGHSERGSTMLEADYFTRIGELVAKAVSRGYFVSICPDEETIRVLVAASQGGAEVLWPGTIGLLEATVEALNRALGEI